MGISREFDVVIGEWWANVQQPFKPSTLPDLGLWLDGADPNGNGVIPSNNTPVATWYDKSGNSNNFSNSNVSTQPVFITNYTGNNGSVLFNGSTTNLTATYSALINTDDTSVFCVCAANGDPGFGSPFCTRANNGGGTPWGYNFYLTAGANWAGYIATGQGSLSFVIGPTFTIDTNTSMSIFGNSSQCSYYVDGVLPPNAINPFGSLVDGSVSNIATVGCISPFNGASLDFFFDGPICEIIIYSRSLTMVEVNKIYNYLNTKWQISLPVTPPSYAGLQVWLDAADPNGNGTIPANNSSLAAWQDKSANAHVFAQSSAPLQPVYMTNQLNGLPTIAFASSYMDGPVTPTVEYTMFVVFSSTAVILQQYLFSNGEPNVNGQSMLAVTSTGNFGMNYGGVDVLQDGTALSQYDIFSFQWDGTTTTCMYNGSPQVVTNDNVAPLIAATLARIGADGAGSNLFTGNIAEIVFYNVSLTAPEVANIYNYLDTKWGI